MGKFERLRSKAFSLRGAIALAGAAVVAASMSQSVDTLAASPEVRTAKVDVVSQNYFPTPLPSSISCSEKAWFPGRDVVISWSSAGQGMKYLVRIIRDNDDSKPGNIINEFFTDSTSHQFHTNATNKSDRVRIHTVNVASGNTDATRVVSTGYVSHTVHVSTVTITYCSGSPRYDAPNQDWENQYAWDVTNNSTASTLGASIFAALFDEEASREILGELPEGDELTALDDVALDSAPTPSMVESTVPSSPRPGPSTSARESAPSATPQSSSAQATSDVATSESSTSRTTRSSSPTVTSLLPEPSLTQAETSPSSSVPTPASTTTTPSVKAGVGDSPIPVGEAFARLEDVDGRTHLILSRGGAEVCSADVDGASRIEETNGELTVIVAGRTSTVDIGTCELA